MLMWISHRFRIKSLRAFIFLVIVGIVSISLVLSGMLFYTRSATMLKDSYEIDVSKQFEQINNLIDDCITQVDSIFPLLMSNITIRENLEPTSKIFQSATAFDRQLNIERQVTSLIISNYIWNQKLINAVYICGCDQIPYVVSLKSQSNTTAYLNEAAQFITDSTSLQIISTVNREHSLYLARNIYSIYTGSKIASIVIEIDQDAFKEIYMTSVDEHWLVYLFKSNGELLNKPSDASCEKDIRVLLDRNILGQGMQNFDLNDINYEVIASTLSYSTLTTVIAAPTEYLYQELQNTLTGFIWMFAAIILGTLFVTAISSSLIASPIDNMITQIKSISSGKSNSLVSQSIYTEFEELTNAFNNMLDQLEINYSEIYEKQVLLKSAEIKALQSQMDPHFLFNVLDSIAWKAEISDNDEIYQMVVSLAEIMRINILSKESEFISLEQELKYIRFYVHLQQTRFEDKFQISVEADESLLQCKIPCFSIQPLVENAIIHGLEPKKGPGNLDVSITDEDGCIKIIVEDNGVGFDVEPSLETIKPSGGERTHIGLKNLNRRLALLYGNECKLHISSTPNISTRISYTIPKRR